MRLSDSALTSGHPARLKEPSEPMPVTVRARSREQLDNLYRELCDHPQVVMVL